MESDPKLSEDKSAGCDKPAVDAAALHLDHIQGYDGRFMSSGLMENYNMRKEVERKLDEFDYANPLGISCPVHVFLQVTLPVVVIMGAIMILFCLWTLKSPFLRDLIVQPALVLLLHLHLLLLVVGPGYILLVQTFHLHIHHKQLYACFILTWLHNFAVLSISVALFTVIFERGLSIGKPEILWALLRRATINMIRVILLSTIVLACAGFLFSEGERVVREKAYPICLPWWENVYGDNKWFKLLAFISFIGPGVFILIGLIALTVSTYRYSALVKGWTETLSKYKAHIMELKSTVHMKFIHSARVLGVLYLFLAIPLGSFIIIGPVIEHRSMQKQLSTLQNMSIMVTERTVGTPGKDLEFAYNVSQGRDGPNQAEAADRDQLGIWDCNYLLISRTDMEAILWTMYYCFSLLLVPVLLSTEVLLRREWKGQLRKVIRHLCCKKTDMPSWPNLDHLMEESHSDDLVGPYVAKDDQRFSRSAEPGPNSIKKGKLAAVNIFIYDASKAVKAGRTLTTFFDGVECAKTTSNNTNQGLADATSLQAEAAARVTKPSPHHEPPPVDALEDTQEPPVKVPPGSRKVLPDLKLLSGPTKQAPEIELAINKKSVSQLKTEGAASKPAKPAIPKEIAASDHPCSASEDPPAGVLNLKPQSILDLDMDPNVKTKSTCSLDTGVRPSAWKLSGGVKSRNDSFGKKELEGAGLYTDLDGSAAKGFAFSRVKWQDAMESKKKQK